MPPPSSLDLRVLRNSPRRGGVAVPQRRAHCTRRSLPTKPTSTFTGHVPAFAETNPLSGHRLTRLQLSRSLAAATLNPRFTVGRNLGQPAENRTTIKKKPLRTSFPGGDLHPHDSHMVENAFPQPRAVRLCRTRPLPPPPPPPTGPLYGVGGWGLGATFGASSKKKQNRAQLDLEVPGSRN